MQSVLGEDHPACKHMAESLNHEAEQAGYEDIPQPVDEEFRWFLRYHWAPTADKQLATALALVLGILPQHPLIALGFVILGSAFMGALGLLAGIFANKFDQMAAITNFIVTPLAFLSGTFYSVQALPPVLNRLSHVNPVFYLIDGLRYGIIGVSDSSPWLGMAVCGAATLLIGAATWQMLRTGYRLKA